MLDIELAINIIPGWLTGQEGRCLHNLVGQSPTPLIVEIGSWKGRSTSWLLLASHQYHKELHTIDTFEGSKEHREAWGKIDVQGEFVANIEYIQTLYNIPDQITVHRMTSKEAAGLFNDGSIGMVFIDGSHEYEDIKLDLANYLPKMADGGIVTCHDFNWPGVQKAIMEIDPKDLMHGPGSIVYWKHHY